MKINSRYFKRFLEQDFKKFAAAMLVGNNEKLMAETVDELCKRVLAKEQDTHNKVRLPSSYLVANFHAFLNEIRSIPLFGENKIIIISDIIQPSLFELLQNFFHREDIPGNVFIIMLCSRILGDSVKTLFEKSEHVAVLPCYLEDSAALELNRSSAELECDVYVALMFEKRFLQAEIALEKLISAGIKSAQIIRCALRYYVQLYASQGLVSAGTASSQVAGQLKPRIFFKYMPAFNVALKEYSVHHVLYAIEQLVALEISSKAGYVENAWAVCRKKLYEILSAQV